MLQSAPLHIQWLTYFHATSHFVSSKNVQLHLLVILDWKIDIGSIAFRDGGKHWIASQNVQHTSIRDLLVRIYKKLSIIEFSAEKTCSEHMWTVRIVVTLLVVIKTFKSISFAASILFIFYGKVLSVIVASVVFWNILMENWFFFSQSINDKYCESTLKIVREHALNLYAAILRRISSKLGKTGVFLFIQKKWKIMCRMVPLARHSKHQTSSRKVFLFLSSIRWKSTQ